jgi:hypothetical protein
MRKLVAVVAVAALAAGLGVTALAVTRGGRTPANCIDSVWKTNRISTSSAKWTRVTGFSATPAAIFPIAVDVSALVSGAPVKFRVLSTNVGVQTRASQPGATRFVPAKGRPDSFAYRWIEPNQSTAIHVARVRLQWRSPSGRPVHLLRGIMSVSYATEQGACDGSS